MGMLALLYSVILYNRLVTLSIPFSSGKAYIFKKQLCCAFNVDGVNGRLAALSQGVVAASRWQSKVRFAPGQRAEKESA